MMQKIFGIAVLSLLALPVSAQQARFTLRLSDFSFVHHDPRTEARLAEWNSPLGRVRYAMADIQGSVGRAGEPHTPMALALRVKVKKGQSPSLVTAAINRGLQLSESSVAVIHWPWAGQPPNLTKNLPLDEQLSILLGKRIESR